MLGRGRPAEPPHGRAAFRATRRSGDPLAARDTGPATGRAAFRATRRSAEQLLELYTIRPDGPLDGRLEDRYERTDRMDSNMSSSTLRRQRSVDRPHPGAIVPLPLSPTRILCVFTPAPVPPAPAPSLHAPPRPHPPYPYPSCYHMSRPGPAPALSTPHPPPPLS